MRNKIFFFVSLFCIMVAPLSAKEIKHNGVDFHVSDDIAIKHNELIELILHTESMDNEERQYWFDIMPSMTESQIKRLFDILDTERKKLAELEDKYQKQVKVLNEKHLIDWRNFNQKKLKDKVDDYLKRKGAGGEYLYCLAYSRDEIPKIRIAVISDSVKSLYIPDDNDTFEYYEHMVMVEFGKKIFNNMAEYRKLYGSEMLDAYMIGVMNSAVSMGDTNTLAYMKDHNLIDRDRFETSVCIAKGDYKTLFLQYEKELNSDKWKDNLFVKLAYMTGWRGLGSCDGVCVNVLKKYFDRMIKENYPFRLDSIKGAFLTELILLDMINYLNKDIMSEAFREKINLFIRRYSGDEDAFAKQNKEWYIKLNSVYFNSSIKELYQQTFERYLKTEDINSVDGDLMEVGVYYAFYLLKNGEEKEAQNVLLASKRLGKSMYSTAYKYIEKNLIDYLIDLSLKPKYRKGSIMLGKLVEENGKMTHVPFQKRYAVIIGVADYLNMASPTGLQEPGKYYDLKYSEDDALAFEKFLRTPEVSGGDFEIYPFIGDNAKTYQVKDKVEEVLSNARENDLIYLFFSGHARLNPKTNKEVYLLTQECDLKNQFSGIEYRWLISAINETKASHVIAFIDSCRSGSVENSKGHSFVNQELLTNILNSSPTKVVFASASGEQLSYEDPNLKKGVFTYFLLEGLYGKSDDFDNDGLVNLYELEDYVSKKVREHTLSKSSDFALQKPQVSNLDRKYSVTFPLSIRIK